VEVEPSKTSAATTSRRERRDAKRQGKIAIRRRAANDNLDYISLLQRWFRARFNPFPCALYIASIVLALKPSGWTQYVAIAGWIVLVFPFFMVSDAAMFELRGLDDLRSPQVLLFGSFLSLGVVGQLAQHLTDDGRIPGNPSFLNVRALVVDIKRIHAENEVKEAARRAAEEEARKREIALKQENERKEREAQEAARREHEERIAAGYLPFRRIAQLRLALPRWPKDADDFEWIARDWIEAWGDSDAEVTPQSHDYGIDVVSAHCVAQMKFYSNKPVGRPEI